MSANEFARAFLESVSGYGQDDRTPPPGAAPPIKLATIDPSYGGSGNARVTFDGESVLGLRSYPILEPVLAGNRVVMLPIGHGYVILGKLGGGSWYQALLNADQALSDAGTLLAGRITSLEGERRGTAGQPWAMAAGETPLVVGTTGLAAPVYWNGMQAIAFPAGRFTVPPILDVTLVDTSTGSIMGGTTIESKTASGFNIRASRINAYPGTNYRYNWIAVQMLSGAAAG